MGILNRYFEKSTAEKIRIAIDILVLIAFILWAIQLKQNFNNCVNYFCENPTQIFKICNTSFYGRI